MKILFILNVAILIGLAIACSSNQYFRPHPNPRPPHRPKIVRKCTKRPLVIAIIDTGFGYRGLGHEARLCKFGHKNFSAYSDMTMDYGTKDSIPLDSHGHGTNIAGIIQDNAEKSDTNFCMVILKYYDPRSDGSTNIEASALAIKYAKNINADFINYSGGGLFYSEEEAEAVKEFIDNGGIFVAAAGNEYSNIDKHPFYPAMSDLRTFIVGGTYRNGETMKASNYGDSITKWEIGDQITGFGITMSGTSQATATATGKLVARIKNDCN